MPYVDPEEYAEDEELYELLQLSKGQVGPLWPEKVRPNGCPLGFVSAKVKACR